MSSKTLTDIKFTYHELSEEKKLIKELLLFCLTKSTFKNEFRTNNVFLCNAVNQLHIEEKDIEIFKL